MTALRCSLVELVATVALAALVRLTVPAAGLPSSAAPFDELLVCGCAVVALAAGAWLWVVTTVVALEAARGRVRAVPGVPAVVRRVVLAACGLALVGAAVPAAATAPPDDRGVLHGLPMPDRASSTAAWVADTLATATPPESGPAPEGRRAGQPRATTVRAGDTLWDIAATGLADGAGPAAVAARAQRLHDLNRDVIGDDPDLIHPGQRLRLPPTLHRGAPS